LNVVNIVGSVIIPYKVIRYFDFHPFLAIVYLQIAMILTFKLISYAHVMRNLKEVDNLITLKYTNSSRQDILD